MIDAAPLVNIDDREYLRLLGYPPTAEIGDRPKELMSQARDWYASNGKPWVYSRTVELTFSENTFALDGVLFTGQKLRGALEVAGAHQAVLVAAGAGANLEAESQRLWQDERPDEYFFLDVFGSAVVEQLVTQAGARLCEWADPQGLAILPHQSPGYEDWDMSEQSKLLNLIDLSSIPERIEALDSGMLRPKKSMLAVFGVTQHVDRVTPLSGLVPCEDCSFGPCRFRRAPYRGHTGGYRINRRALARWARERLELDPLPNGGIDAVFHYEGTTCTNLRLDFDYRVTLGPAREGYPIRSQSCVPAPCDTGRDYMCGLQREGVALLDNVAAENPLRGAPLAAVLNWRRPDAPAGCYCDASSRAHKWGLVLETIHYALNNRNS